MDWGTSLIGIIFLVICIIIFVFLSNTNSKKEKALLESLKLSAGNISLIPDEYDLWRNSVIAMTRPTKMIYALRTIDREKVPLQVSLGEIRSCKIIHTKRNADAENGLFRETEKLELVFSHIAQGVPEKILVFYDASRDFSLNGELQLIEKWQKLVEDELNAIPKPATQQRPCQQAGSSFPSLKFEV